MHVPDEMLVVVVDALEPFESRPASRVAGDRNRNCRLARLRVLLPPGNAIVGIDLASDKQAAVVTDHDSRVLARRRVVANAWELGELLDWAWRGRKRRGSGR